MFCFSWCKEFYLICFVDKDMIFFRYCKENLLISVKGYVVQISQDGQRKNFFEKGKIFFLSTYGRLEKGKFFMKKEKSADEKESCQLTFEWF